MVSNNIVKNIHIGACEPRSAVAGLKPWVVVGLIVCAVAPIWLFLTMLFETMSPSPSSDRSWA